MNIKAVYKEVNGKVFIYVYGKDGQLCPDEIHFLPNDSSEPTVYVEDEFDEWRESTSCR